MPSDEPAAPPMDPAPQVITLVGLSQGEAARRLAIDGRNETRPPADVSLPRKILAQLTDPLIALLLAAAAVTAATGDIPDTAVIVLVVVVNTAIGVAQEIRADRAIAALRSLGAPTCRVIRDGVERVIPTAEVVRGDVVRLSAGDIVPADAMIDEASLLQLNESALTGESVPVSREPGELASAGTVVAAGRGVGTVIRTGSDSALGRIVQLTERARSGPTPLQRKLARLGKVLGMWVVAFSAIVSIIGILRGRPVVEMAIVGVSLVVAAVPESLPAVVTLALALGARRMAAAHAITRRLSAVETLGSVTTLITDKTGTLTQGRMAIEHAVTATGVHYIVSGDGYEPTGKAAPTDDGVLDPAGLAAMARAAVLCNDAELIPPSPSEPSWSVAGESIEGALLAFAARTGTDIAETRASAPRTGEIPFDQSSRMMTTTHTVDGRQLTVYKGAPESVLRPDLLDNTADSLARLRQSADEITGAGMRVLALASGPPGGVRALGVVGIGDPVRPAAAEALRDLDGAGIDVVMVTGDHPATGRRVAESVGIWHDGDVVLNLGDERRAGQAAPRVYARATPEDKLSIVDSLKTRGHVVAVTGDGVNDAPALRHADIGVAMGGGTEVAHQAAQLVLADDRLATVGAAVAEGRRVYDNIRRFLRYALSGGLAELVTMLVGPALGMALPLLPAQILWINLLTHGLPGVAMGAEPASPAAMRRPPRSPSESVLGAGLGRGVLLTGALISACTLGVGAYGVHQGLPWQTMVFLTLGLAQLGVALAVRAPRRAGVGNVWLGASVALSAVLMIAGVYLGPLNTLLGTTGLTVTELAISAAAAVIPGLLLAALRRRQRSMGKRMSVTAGAAG